MSCQFFSVYFNISKVTCAAKPQYLNDNWCQFSSSISVNFSPSGIIRIIFGITNKKRKNNYPKEHSADFLPDDYYVSVEINNTLISR